MRQIRAEELRGGDTVVEEDDSYVLEYGPKKLTEYGDTLIAWAVGDKLPIYFFAGELVNVA